jgi:hypothetical protein
VGYHSNGRGLETAEGLDPVSKLSLINLAFAAGLCCAVMLSLVSAAVTGEQGPGPEVWLTGIASVLAGVAALVEARGNRGLYTTVSDHETRIRTLEKK